MAATTRATSAEATGEVLPRPNGSSIRPRSPTLGPVRGRKKPSRKTVGRMMTTGRPNHASACSLATFVCVFFLGPALLRGGLASIGPADGEAATQEFSIGAGSGQA